MLNDKIIRTIQSFYPDIQAIYLFGSYGSEYERPDSDIDIAILLPPVTAKRVGNISYGKCWVALVELCKRSVDLVNLRFANTVFQHEIIQTGKIILNIDQIAVAEFEMLCLSFYQKLNEERRDIIADIIRTKQILNPSLNNIA